MKLTKKKILMILAAVAVLVVLANLPKRKMQMPPMEETVYTVKTQKLVRSDLQEYLRLNGTVKAENTISVYPDIGGKLTRVPVTLGTYVKKGQLIAEVDPSSPGSYYSASPVYAPIAGYITSLPLTTGTTVSTSTEIATIGNIEKLQVECKIPESKISVLKNGLTARVGLEAYKDKGIDFPAHIFRISPVVDETSRTKQVYLIFDTDDSRINAGMYVKIHLNTVLHENVITVPTDCIQSKSGQQYVYVYDESSGTVSQRNITTGATVDGVAEVTEGLNEGERIVVSGMQVLADGVKVKEVGSSNSAEKAAASQSN
ncbi:efflux RND transporter periplasmic adaptor subunit [Treponema sp.]|uniref:efflux RND transporter periplasmic adaptor subunit n=1 Tax=Treponema sp. TaxID=166 RepID=UPI00388D3D69